MSRRELSPHNSATILKDKAYNLATNSLPVCAEFPPKEQCKVLNLGCGSSSLGIDMMKDKWIGGIVNVDYSKTVIEQMEKRHDDSLYRKIQAKLNREKRAAAAVEMSDSRNETSTDKTGSNQSDHNEKAALKSLSQETAENKVAKSSQIKIPRMKFECVDVTKSLPYSDAEFDLIVNKGTMDSILCSNGAITNIKTMMKECSRVLKPHGSMVVVSHAKPDDRLLYFENDEKWWPGGVKVYKVRKPNLGALVMATGSTHHFVYVASK